MPLVIAIVIIWGTVAAAFVVSWFHERENLPAALAEIKRLRDLLAWNGIDPDAVVESSIGADKHE